MIGTASKLAVVTGPNDHHLDEQGLLQPGLGREEEDRIRAARGLRPDTPDRAELREQAAALASKAKQLTTAERELVKEKKAAADALDAKERDLAEREAILAAHMKKLGLE